MTPAEQTTSPRQSFDDLPQEPWRRETLRRELEFRVPSESPEAVVIAGQPGAGCPLLAAAVRRVMAPRGRCTCVDPEELVLTHPLFAVYSREKPDQQDQLLRPLAAELAAELLHEALRRRLHLVLVCTFDSAENADVLFEDLRVQRYHTTLVVPVVQPEVSWQRAHAETLRQQRTMSVAHWHDRAHHDQACRQLWEALQFVEDEGGVDRCVLLQDSGPTLVDSPARHGLPPGTVRRIRSSLALQGTELTSRPVDPVFPPGASIDFSRYTVAEQRRIAHRLELQRILRQAANSEREGAR